MTGRSAVGLACLMVAGMLLADSQAGEPEDAALLERIRAAWQARQNRIGSIELEWEEDKVRARSAADLAAGRFDPAPGNEPAGTVTDRKTMRFHYRCEFVFSGSKLRHFSDEPVLRTITCCAPTEAREWCGLTNWPSAHTRKSACTPRSG